MVARKRTAAAAAAAPPPAAAADDVHAAADDVHAAAAAADNNEDEDAPACWICYSGSSAESGQLIRPCSCKGSMAHAHAECIQRWVQSSRADIGNRMNCPTCDAPYVTQSGGVTQLGESLRPHPWKDRWLPDFEQLDSIDETGGDDYSSDVKWRMGSSVISVAMWGVLCLGQMVLLLRFWQDVERSGYGPPLTADKVGGSSVMRSMLSTVVGKEAFEQQTSAIGGVMSVSQKWSGVFKQCQMLQFYVTIVNMFWHTLGMHDWVMRDDMGPLAFMWDERGISFFFFCINPPVLRYARIFVIELILPLTAVYKPLEGWALWGAYKAFSSHVDVALHILLSCASFALFVRAARNEWARLRHSVETTWNMSQGDLVIQDVQVLDRAATAPGRLETE